MCDPNQLLAPLEEFLISLDDFRFEKIIGKGGYAEVWLATHKGTGAKCAIKKLFLQKLEGQNLQFFVREVRILSCCHDLFLLPFQGFTNTYPYSIATEYIPNGSLFEALQHRPGAPRLSSSHKTLIAIGIAHGMMELHKQSIVHRDLKSLNILLDDRLLPKICDFGISRFAGQNDEMTKEIGTPHWMAPEIFESDRYTEKVDVYAYGMILWEMLTEQVPFKGKTSVQVAIAVCNNNERPAIPPSCPTTLKNLIQMCWQRDPEKRPSFKQIYHALSEKKTMYRDTDPRSINAILMLIKDEEKKRVKDPLQHLISRKSSKSKKQRENQADQQKSQHQKTKEETKQKQQKQAPVQPEANPFLENSTPTLMEKSMDMALPPPVPSHVKRGVVSPEKIGQAQANSSESPQNIQKFPKKSNSFCVPSAPQLPKFPVLTKPANDDSGTQIPHFVPPKFVPLQQSKPQALIPEDQEERRQKQKKGLVANEDNIFLNLDQPALISPIKSKLDDEEPKYSVNKLKENPNSQDFREALNYIFHHIHLYNPKEVFALVSQYFYPEKKDLQVTTLLVLKRFYKLFKKHKIYISPFTEMNLHQELPFHDPIFLIYDSQILSFIVDFDITKISANTMVLLANTFVSMFNNQNNNGFNIEMFAEHVLNVFGKFIMKMNVYSNSNSVIRAFFSMRNEIIKCNHSDASIDSKNQILVYLRIIFYMYKTYPWVKQMHLVDITNTLSLYFTVTQFSVLLELYNFILSYVDLIPYVPLDKVVQHLSSPLVCQHSLKFLMHIDTIPSSKRLVKALVSLKNNDISALLLCRIAEQTVGAQIILDHMNEWYEFSPENVSKIFFTLFTIKNVRPLIAENPTTSAVLLKILDLGSSSGVFQFLPTLIRRMTLSQNFVKKLSSVGFMGSFIVQAFNSSSFELQSSCIMLCDTIARVCYLPDFDALVPILPQLMKNTSNINLTQSALTLSLVLFSHKELRGEMRKSSLKDVLSEAKVSPQYEQYKTALLQQLNKE